MARLHRKPLRHGLTALAVIMAPLALFFIAAFIGSHLARNPGWRSEPRGVPVLIDDNGVHVSLIVPVAAEGVDLRPLLGFALPRGRITTHVGISWGEGHVFRDTPRWQDLSLTDAVRALFGSNDVLIHVDAYYRPGPAPWRRRIMLTPAAWRRLAASIGRSFARVGDPGTSGYGPDDRFFLARGHYDALHDCNQWAANRLADAGVIAPRWSPFSGGVMRWYAR